MKIIFIDIDGVLNGYNKRLHIVGNICMKINLLKKLWFKWNPYDIRWKYVKNLSKIVRKTNAKIVISSSWRSGWNIPYNECSPRMRSLKDKLHHYKIDVIGITPYIYGKREDEISEWLEKTDYKIDNFVILDDESFDLQNFVGNHLVKTSNKNKSHICSGLTLKYVKQAIKILNS